MVACPQANRVILIRAALIDLMKRLWFNYDMLRASSSRSTYVPPSVQQALSQHMQRSMPAHLQKYQSGQGYIPQHAERAITSHMKKTLPTHLKKYADPYVQQNVVFPGAGTTRRMAASPRVSPPTPYRTPYIPGQQKGIFAQAASNGSGENMTPQSSQDPVSTSPGQPGYDFILNPPQPPKKPLLSLPGGNSALTRAIVVGVGLIFLTIIAVVLASLLSSSSKAQTERLLEVAQTQTEILRVAETTQGKISSSDLSELLASTTISTRSGLNDVVRMLGARGIEANDKRLALGEDPKNDETLTQAEQNSRFDEAYKALLEGQLNSYQALIKSAYDGADPDEQQALASLFEQVSLLKTQLESIR